MKQILCFTALVSCFTTLGASAQSVADVARQERARRQNTQSTVTITNSTMKPATETAKTEAAAEAAKTEATKTEAAKTPETAITRDEKWWRKEFQTAREDLKRSEDQLTVLQLDLNRVNRDYLQRSDIYNRENRLAAEIAQINAKMETTRKEAESARRKISQLEDELRRANAPAGWSR
jgi:hypothetical protein